MGEASHHSWNMLSLVSSVGPPCPACQLRKGVRLRDLDLAFIEETVLYKLLKFYIEKQICLGNEDFQKKYGPF